MNKTFAALLAVMLHIGIAFSQSEYQYTVDLVNVEKDMVKVTMTPPALNSNEAVFIMPKVVPGTYATENFGRFIKKFTAFDASGKKLKVKQKNMNQFFISGTAPVAHIEYYVNDTWDDKDARHFIFQPGGSNIEAGKNFVINPFAFFGYFDGYKMNPYKIEVTKPKDFYGSGHLTKVKESSTKDVLTSPDYVHLSDNPIMYCLPDTVSFKVANSTVNVSVFSSTGIIKSKQIADYLTPIADALKKFFVTLPVDEYHFIFYFVDPLQMPKSKAGGLSSGFGALEHNQSSFYYLPETKYEKAVRETVEEVSAHEFLHILTPLNIHSREIEDFDFLNPKMSKHLWMYEGVTEYFAHLSQFRAGLTEEEQFIRQMRSKIIEAKQFGNFSMTDMSANVLDKKNQDLYLSVYNKGAVLAMLLDIRIAELSKGEKNLKWLMMELAGKYGPSKPFDDNQLFNDIVALTHPDIRSFISSYIEGSEPLPYESYFAKAGWNYENTQSKKVYTCGYFGLRYNPKTNEIIFDKVNTNLLGLVNGDVLLAVNGVESSPANVGEQFRETFQYNTSDKEVSVTIRRSGETKTLTAKPKESVSTVRNSIEVAKEFTEEQQRIRRIIFDR